MKIGEDDAVKRWDWKWEETRSTPEPEPPSEVPEPLEREDRPSVASQSVRRRRLAVALVLAMLLVLLIILIAGGGSAKQSRAPAAAATRTHARVPPRVTAAQSEAIAAAAEERAIDRVLSYTPAVTAGGGSGHEVALTFDDGPGPYTQQLVRVLNRYHVRATFFAIGEEERYFSAGTRLELESGDAVGDHTETHPMMATLSAHDQREELFEQIARIELLGGPRPRLFRPPYGSFDATTFNELRALHLLMVLWSTDTRDYTRPGVSAIVQSALAGAHPGAIILMHDAGGERAETIAALPLIIAGLRKRGLHPVTVPRLMLDDPPPRGLPIPTSLAGD
jgi:peptidoglycan/xylan/chitin deacetylase (PgdA/CDA1 family)